MFQNITLFSICMLINLGLTYSVSAQARLNRPERLGLTEVWTKAIPTGLGGRISGVHLHISSNSTYNTADVVDRHGRHQFFSDLDTRLSRSSGFEDHLLRRTELKKAELAARGLDPRVESREVPQATLYVRGSSGMVTAINAENGQLLWATQAGKQGYPSYSVAASDDYVVAVSSTKMYLLDAVSGQVLDTVSTRSIPSGTPTLDGEFIYVPTWRGLIEVYSTEDFGQVEFTLGSTHPVIGTVTLCPDSVSWATDKGDLYVGNRRRPGIKFRFQSPDTISSAPAYWDGSLFASSLDGFVYSIDANRGNVKWRHSSGGPIDVSPLAIDGMVFATNRAGQLDCLDAKTGEPKWSASGVRRFISVSENRLYYATGDNHLAVIDTATGSRIASAKMASTAVPFVNLASDRLYLASNGGVLSCLRETGRRWPVVRQIKFDEDEKPSTDKAEDSTDESSVPTSPSAGDELPSNDLDDFASAADTTDAADDTAAEGDDSDPFDEFDDGGDDFGGGDGFGDDMDDNEDPFNDL